MEGIFSQAMLSGQAMMKDDDCLFIKRNGFLEESYFSWSIIPLIGEDGSVVGLYNPAFEKTRRKIVERRMLTLREVGERTAAACEVKSFWTAVIKGLEYNGTHIFFSCPLNLIICLHSTSVFSQSPKAQFPEDHLFHDVVPVRGLWMKMLGSIVKNIPYGGELQRSDLLKDAHFPIEF